MLMENVQTHQVELESVFGFANSDLEVNRSGRLSTAQTARLKKHREAQGCGQVIGLIAMSLTVLAIVGIAIYFLYFEELPGIDPAKPYILAVFGSAVLVIALSMIRSLIAKSHLTQGKISVMQGKVKTWKRKEHRENSSAETVLYFNVGRKRYRPESKERWEILINDQYYRFFYVWDGSPVPIILSVEWLKS